MAPLPRKLPTPMDSGSTEPLSARSGCQTYVTTLLALYVRAPGVLGRVRQADRELARQLYQQGIPLHAVEKAFIVGAARRARHNAFSTPPPPIRSLHYFKELIREMLDRPPAQREIDELRRSLGIGDLPL